MYKYAVIFLYLQVAFERGVTGIPVLAPFIIVWVRRRWPARLSQLQCGALAGVAAILVALARDVCTCTKQYPRAETYGLVTQMRRAAVSQPSNIAEGAVRSGNKEFTQFLYIVGCHLRRHPARITNQE